MWSPQPLVYATLSACHSRVALLFNPLPQPRGRVNNTQSHSHVGVLITLKTTPTRMSYYNILLLIRDKPMLLLHNKRISLLLLGDWKVLNSNLILYLYGY